MRHALFITFQYPPDASSSGVLRTLKYTRYLADHEWRVTVLSIEPSAYETVDQGTLAQIPGNVRVVRTSYLDTKKHLSLRGRYLAITALPDRYIGWLPWAVRAGMRIGRSDRVDLVYSTSPPATAHLIAWRVSRGLGKPWVIDFRDPWFEEPPEPGAPGGPLFRRVDRWFEGRIVRDADHVVSTTASLRDLLVSRYPELPRGKFSVIPNGYDEDDFARLSRAGPVAGDEPDRMCIVHSGSINPMFRDPVPLVRALSQAAELGLVDSRKVRLRFLGGGPHADDAALHRSIADSGVSTSVEMLPRLPYADALDELTRADVLLLLQASDDTRGLVPAKLYEYLRMGKPVLALTLPGESADLLARTGGGWVVDPADPAQIVQAIGRLYRFWQERSLGRFVADPQVLARYERRRLAAQLAEVFSTVAGSSP